MGMKRILIVAFLLLGVASADTLNSGLEVGDFAPAHNPYHVTGPDADTTICPV